VSEILISVRGLSKEFRRGATAVQALRDINLDVFRGEYLSVMGPSGSGKSTLFNMIGGLDRPTAGEILLDGKDIASLTERKLAWLRCNRIGYVFQTFNLLSPLTALENLLVPAALCGEKADEAAARQILEELGLAGHLDKRPYELSVGQRQRVAVARAVLRSPSVLLADEPTANLDEGSTRAVIDAMRRLRDAGATLVLATHDPILAEAFPGVALDVVTGEVRR